MNLLFYLVDEKNQLTLKLAKKIFIKHNKKKITKDRG